MKKSRFRTPRTVQLVAIFAISALFFTALMRWVEAPFITDAETEAVEEIGPKAPAIDTKGFLAGDIISDDVFRNSHSMSQEQVEAFISEVNEGCVTGFDGTDCIADARFATEDLPADGWCAGNYRGEPAESAASIIIKASLACQINPQVILAMLQKEQSLLTASGENLGQSRYIAAMGYGCPDHTNCDPTFAGFQRQIWYAARQFNRYEMLPNEYWLKVGQTIDVAYSPDSSCGSAPLTLVNQATVNLYLYTPYQPNEAAIEAEGNECSSWGNLNFYSIFRAWFGRTHSDWVTTR